jgi:hypothetical protein
MADKPQRVTVLHEGVLTGNAFIDRDQDLFLPQELKQMPQGVALSLNNLSHAHRSRQLASQVSFAVGRLKLSHQRDCYHDPASFQLKKSARDTGALTREAQAQ